MYFLFLCLVIRVGDWSLGFHLESSWAEAALIRLRSLCLAQPPPHSHTVFWSYQQLSWKDVEQRLRNLWLHVGFNLWLLPWELSSLESFYILTRRPPRLLLKSFGWWNSKFQDSRTQNFCIITLDSCRIFSSSSLWSFRFLKKQNSSEWKLFLLGYVHISLCLYLQGWTVSWFKCHNLMYGNVWS